MIFSFTSSKGTSGGIDTPARALADHHNRDEELTMRRREWIGLALAQSLGGLAPARAQTGIKFETNPFRLGVASGHPTDQSVVLWTRLSSGNPYRNPWGDRAVEVTWELATEPSFGLLVQSGRTMAPPELSHSVHVEITGLEAGRVYYYRFHSHGAQSPVGRTLTLPAAGSTPERLRLGFASCQRYHSGSFVAYDHLRADAPDLVVFLGDYIYEMGATTSEVRGDWAYPANKIADYRGLYELAKSDPALQAMHAWCPWLVTWDDHEVFNDYAGGDVRAGKDTGRMARRMAMGYQTWYEHMPVSPRMLLAPVAGRVDGDREIRVHGSHRWGRLANLMMLDTRQYRSAAVGCGVAGVFKPDACDEAQTAGRSMLGESQEAWLLDQLRANATGAPGGALWNLICQPSVFSRFMLPVGGGMVSNDNWDGYPVSRRRILQAITDHKTSNPVVLGGDIHQNWVSHVTMDPANAGSPVVMPEFCGTSISTPSFGPVTAGELKALAPHCLYTERHQRGYGLVTLTPQQMRVDLRVLDDIRKSPTTVTTAASFEVKSGAPTIARVA